MKVRDHSWLPSLEIIMTPFFFYASILISNLNTLGLFYKPCQIDRTAKGVYFWRENKTTYTVTLITSKSVNIFLKKFCSLIFLS